MITIPSLQLMKHHVLFKNFFSHSKMFYFQNTRKQEDLSIYPILMQWQHYSSNQSTQSELGLLCT